jgi:hypothetical protein
MNYGEAFTALVERLTGWTLLIHQNWVSIDHQSYCIKRGVRLPKIKLIPE